MYNFIKYQKSKGIAFIYLNRPDMLNCFNKTMALELQEILDYCDNDKEIRAVLLCGEGRAFCAGQDLQEATSGEFEIAEIVRNHYNPIINKIRNLSKPVVVAVNGVAAGAGANIALSGDIVFASDKASFIQAFSKIGLIPDSGGTYILPRLIGLQKASALMMLGDKLTANEAESMGLIYKVIEHDNLLSTAIATAEKLSNMPTSALALTKKLLNLSFTNTLQEQLNLEEQYQDLAGKTHDYQEGVHAFLEKREPIFRGE